MTRPSPPRFLTYYQRIYDTCEPYVITRRPVVSSLDLAPFRLPIPESNVFDPETVAAGDFVTLVKRLDDITYGPIGLSMPSWVFYDCAVMPGAVFGFAKPAASVESWVKRVLDVPDGYDGLIPMSIMIAIPSADPDVGIVYTLASINQVAAGAAPEGLWRLTLAAGTRTLGLHEVVAPCQWRSPQLGLFAGMGPLRLLTAWTPAHDNPTTATFRLTTDAAARERLLRGDLVGREGIHRYLDADDHQAMRDLQSDIESGLVVAIVGPAEICGAETRVPLQIQGGTGSFVTDRGVKYRRRFQG